MADEDAHHAAAPELMMGEHPCSRATPQRCQITRIAAPAHMRVSGQGSVASAIVVTITPSIAPRVCRHLIMGLAAGDECLFLYFFSAGI